MATKKRAAPLLPLPIRVARLHEKLAIAVLVGILVALLLLAVDLNWLARMLAGWDVGIAVYLSLTYLTVLRADIERIRRRAAEQDEGAAFILALSIIATFASLVAVVFALAGSKHGGAVLPVLLAIVTIVLSWTFVHMIFSFHYAHEFYGEGRDREIGGLRFPGDGRPDYRDFLYFSLVIGMTSQVSDVAIESSVIRRLAAVHGVLSFFFNLVVLALTVSMVGNLL